VLWQGGEAHVIVCDILMNNRIQRGEITYTIYLLSQGISPKDSLSLVLPPFLLALTLPLLLFKSTRHILK
jgi:hypothetical protein